MALRSERLEVRWITAVEAAGELHLTERELERLVMSGVVLGKRDPATRELRVTRKSVARVLQQRGEGVPTGALHQLSGKGGATTGKAEVQRR